LTISAAMTEAEFDVMLGDVGVSVVCGGVTAEGLLDFDDATISGESGFSSSLGAGSQSRGEVIGRTITVTVLSSTFVGVNLESDVPITVDGTAYVIRYGLEHSHMSLDLTTLYLGKN
jgi:hypothetical protein